ncbi:MFS family permease [Lactobacillus colini]|uniref:MFS family permease n=1 Tax=Lactobacillus colini TaxID=1819254 RepID=A0ABS4MGM7_9LACO|nr:MFS family permease [Lactobacillus colini]
MKKSHHNFFAWWIFAACCLISLVGFGLLVNTIGLFFEPISKEFRVGRASVALMTTFQNAAAAISLLVAGKVMEKFNLKWLLITCFSLIGISLLTMSMATSLVHFYLGWILIGICQPIAITLSIPVLLSNWFNEKLGSVMGIALGLSAFGGTIFNPIIASIINGFGWRVGLISEGGLILVILVPAALLLLERPNSNYPAYGTTKANPQATSLIGINLRQALKRPIFYALAFAMLALQFVSGSVQHISGHIINLNISPIIAATVVSAVMLGAAAGKISIGFFLDHFSSRLTLLIYAIVGASGWLGLILFSNKQLLVISGFVLGLGQGICLVALPYLIRKQFGNKDYSNILSIINMLGAFAMSASVYLVGLFFDQTGSYNLGWIINSAAFLVSFLILAVTLNKNNYSMKNKSAKN